MEVAETRSRDPVPAYRNIAVIIAVLEDEDAVARCYARTLPARTLTLIFIASPPFVSPYRQEGSSPQTRRNKFSAMAESFSIPQS
jgi:hypothetical protein